MFSRDNYIYTNKGLYTPEQLFYLQENKQTLPNVMTFNYDEQTKSMSYEFIAPYQIIKGKNPIEIYSVKFFDMFSAKNITIHCSLDTEILKYTLISKRERYNRAIPQIFTEMIQYIEQNKDLNVMEIAWDTIKNQFDYANRSPNICLGDTAVKYFERKFKSLDVGYSIVDKKNKIIPVFISLTHSTFYNNILVK